jgi:hypothetical protein
VYHAKFRFADHSSCDVVSLQSTPVATPSFAQPFPPLQSDPERQRTLFAILNTGEGMYCLETLLPRASNAPSDYSIFCSGAQWGCCLKQAGLTGCKVRGQIPSRRIPRPPATRSP